MGCLNKLQCLHTASSLPVHWSHPHLGLLEVCFFIKSVLILFIAERNKVLIILSICKFVFKTHTHASLSVGRSSPALDPLQKSPPVEPSAALASSVGGTVPVSRRSPITARLGTAGTQKAPEAPEQRRGEGRSRLRPGLGHAAPDTNVVHSGFQSAGEGA